MMSVEWRLGHWEETESQIMNNAVYEMEHNVDHPFNVGS